ncbi:MAG: hypothetical protein J0647_09085 [Campylobacteraceae bacterium]|nr:hypothetical protein [Campylobacteraceae bacterium]
MFCYILIFTLAIQAKETLSLGSEVQEYDKIFEKIAERRSGIDVSKLDNLNNPFIVTGGSTSGENGDENNATITQPIYILEATFDQRAKINGKWYTIKDKVEALILVKINRNSVVLQSENEKKEIFIRTKDENNIKIFSK